MRKYSALRPHTEPPGQATPALPSHKNTGPRAALQLTPASAVASARVARNVEQRRALIVAYKEILRCQSVFTGNDRASELFARRAPPLDGERRMMRSPMAVQRRELESRLALAEVPAAPPTLELVVAQYSRYVATIGFRILGRGG